MHMWPTLNQAFTNTPPRNIHTLFLPHIYVQSMIYKRSSEHMLHKYLIGAGTSI